MKMYGLRIPLGLAREMEAELDRRSKTIDGPRSMSELVRAYIVRCLSLDRLSGPPRDSTTTHRGGK
jgi:hypothetical protein